MKSVVINDHLTLVHGRDGMFLINHNDVYVGKAILNYGEYNHHEALFLNSLIGPGQCVVEVGANIGAHTVGLAKRVGPEGRVVACEPQKACFNLLTAQIALNDLYNVVALSCALDQTNHTLYYDALDDSRTANFGGVGMTPHKAGGRIEVPAVRLDTVCPSVPDLIKIDVEGMELDVLAGGAGMLRENRSLIYYEDDRIENHRELTKFMLGSGYSLWWHLPMLFNPGNYFGLAKNIYGNTASYNVIAVPKSRMDWFIDTLLIREHGLMPITSAEIPHPLQQVPQ